MIEENLRTVRITTVKIDEKWDQQEVQDRKRGVDEGVVWWDIEEDHVTQNRKDMGN